MSFISNVMPVAAMPSSLALPPARHAAPAPGGLDLLSMPAAVLQVAILVATLSGVGIVECTVAAGAF